MANGADHTSELNTPVQYLKGCGAARAALLAKLGVHTVRDLLFHFPRDYQDLTELRAIGELQEGQAASVLGTIEEVDLVGHSPGRSMLGVLIRQGDQFLRAVWFNQPFLRAKFQRGQTVLASGRPHRRAIRWEMAHPLVRIIDVQQELPAGELLPVYPLTEGLQQRHLRRLMREALDQSIGQLEEVFPSEYLATHDLLPLAVALPALHFPESRAQLKLARRRFIYQELLILQLALAIKRARVRGTLRAAPLELTAKIDSRIRRLLPFQLTQGQNQAISEIADDLAKAVPMNRLLQGDVGSGKTIVAVYAMLLAVAHGAQVVLMAPTEILARQHVGTLERLLAGSNTRIGLLTGGQATKSRQEALAGVADGSVQILVGTHAVLSDALQFQKLGLVIIDEQHRFGVRQRARLKYAGVQPHYLVMTATPIPRTVSMTLFGDLDVTTLRDAPPGRQVVHTYVPDADQRSKWWDFFRRKLREGRQAYVIVPLVSDRAQIGNDADGDSLESARSEVHDAGEQLVPAVHVSIESAYEALANGELEAFRLGLVHGRMPSEEKQQVMEAFACGEIQVLVATSVVEVGIDVPNATLMTIEFAERFGLAQLHQLRGRISRGTRPGYCALFAGTSDAAALQRLAALVEHRDGFKLAELDFELRGPGDVLGTRQHGLPPLRIADLRSDAETVAEAQRDARQLIDSDPTLSRGEYQRLRRMVAARYARVLDLSDVG